ncbi:MAG: rhomboid family intramembrane serine protease [Proteobacteria bacterium]|jgi:membrane associated rhomboid family serine protease|nr:rhomboid family intramembrane serine protease [Pseudomonadota bacterium]
MVRNTLMIPLKDNIPTRTFPIITISIIFVNMLVFLWQKIVLYGIEGDIIYRYYGLIPREFMTSLSSRWDLLPYNILTVFTSMFLHGGFLHLGGNMLYLWIFGNNVEDAMGHKRFIVFFLLSGVIAALFQFFYDPTSSVPMVGASGAISGILGAYLILFPRARIKTLLFIFIFIKIVEIPAILLLTIWFFMQILYSHMEGVAWHAHIGGFVFGLITIKLFIKRRRNA